ncbi:autotransporter outer membrane beta-barrel domain-containing protein [Aquabacter cavernae]|uniref:autotransporter outer membrane beta-barrel domain-containing protein n=1 Tax=Aquabacter cavernae TaxID=2496029 RepID=UPI000F8C6024|nr:autotransporter outer membrane beta-barrel domain-containing protein [Aquabacter cavernae]
MRRQVPSFLLRSTALAGTLAGFPFAFYSRAYAQNCSPVVATYAVSGASAGGKPNTKVPAVTFNCVVPVDDTPLDRPRYAYGGAYSFYFAPPEQVRQETSGKKYSYAGAIAGQPGLNITLTNGLSLAVATSYSSFSLLAAAPQASKPPHKPQKQSSTLSVVSRGSNAWSTHVKGWYTRYRGGTGGVVTIVNTGTLANTTPSGAAIYGLSVGGDAYYGSGGAGGNVSITTSGQATSSSAAVVGMSIGGASGVTKGQHFGSGGIAGGAGGQVAITVTGDVASLSAGPAILGASYGGNATFQTNAIYAYGLKNAFAMGNGGAGGQVDVTLGSTDAAFAGTIASKSVGVVASRLAMSTGGAIVAHSTGGRGLGHYKYSGVHSYYNGGDGGAVNVTVHGGAAARIVTIGDASPGIYAQSLGGGAYHNGTAPKVVGGNGGAVTVTLAGGGTIATEGQHSFGILAHSVGGQGAYGVKGSVHAATGGVVTVTSDFSIYTVGRYSHGIVAQSTSSTQGDGLFVNSGSKNIVWGTNNSYGPGSNDVHVTNSGKIETFGMDAGGIVAQSIGGGGGLLTSNGPADLSTLTATSTSTGQQVGGNVGTTHGSDVHVVNTGVIITHGGLIRQYSADGGSYLPPESATTGGGIGILAQSIGGGGGTNTGTGVLGFMGGGSAAIKDLGGSNGGYAGVRNYGSVSTAASEAHAIMVQSIGGGGGSGRNKAGLVVTVGGRGGAGGNGGQAYAYNAGTLLTVGDYASGIIVQSIGGGGGNGGRAAGWSHEIGVSVGGSAGGGGNGGAVSVKTSKTSDITAQGTMGHAILAQSIGGGGGIGGSSKQSTDSLLVGMSVAFGGTGGTGGAGGSAKVENAGKVSTLYQNSYGMLVQSIGGGGGAGGGSSAHSMTIGVPLPQNPKETVGLSVAATLGGTGGTGGAGGAVSGILDKTGSIATLGDGSSGMVVQSIGGGGGAGGDALSSSTVTTMSNILGSAVLPKMLKFKDDAFTMDLSFAFGGSGGTGNVGGTGYAHNLGRISTSGDFADGILLQSIGGGGGAGGSGDAQSVSFISAATASADLSAGGKGETGGLGGKVQGGVGNTGSVYTTGHNSSGLVVQSIGGGGGKGGAGAGAGAGKTVIQIGIGETGGSGNKGGLVYAWNNGRIVTTGDASVGLLAQSIGGGGGQGGSGTSSVSQKIQMTPFLAEQAGDKINAALKTYVADNLKVGLNSPSFTVTGTMRTGSNGGSGGDGGTVFVGVAKTGTSISIGTTQTVGTFAHGIVAQSVGGGGGMSSLASPANSYSLSQSGNALGQWLQDNLSFDLKSLKGTASFATFTTGSSSGGSGKGGAVTVYANSVQAAGFGAHGVVAQSIGGGGGNAEFSGYAVSAITASLGATSTDKSDNASGGAVSVKTLGSTHIKVSGDNANGIVAQSIGGGGGMMGIALGTSARINDDTLQNIVTMTLGGTMNPNNVNTLDGGVVSIDHAGTIVTSGTRSAGIIAQSIGGGGGLLSISEANLADVKFAADQTRGAGYAVNVSLSGNGSIVTSGDGSAGIIAQSIGGGGGLAADMNGWIYAYYTTTAASLRKNPGYAHDHHGRHSGIVTVDVAAGASITTTGRYAHGIVAQSIAGTGGIFERGGKLYAGSLHRNGDNNQAGVKVTVAGSVTTTGPDSWAVWGQTQNTYASVVVSPGGAVSGYAGAYHSGGAVALFGNEGAALTITNSGHLAGNVMLNTGKGVTAGRLVTEGTGTFQPGVIVDVAYSTINGTLNVGGTGTTQTTRFTGDLVTTGEGAQFQARSYFRGAQAQTWSTATSSRGGVIADLDVDMAAGTSDRIIVDGRMSGTWGLSLKPTTLLPNAKVNFLSVAGENTADITVLSSHIFSFTTPSQDASGWTGFSIAKADFAGAGQGLGANSAAAAGGLQNAWDALASGRAQQAATDGISIGAAFAAFHGSEPATVGDMMDAVSTETAGAVNVLAVEMAMMTAASVLDCPTFTTDAVLQEESCAWSRGIGGMARRSGAFDASGFSMASGGLQLGGQTALGEGWYLGGSAGVLWGNFTGTGNGEQASATTGLLAVALKKEIGPWLFSAAMGGGYSWTESSRFISLGTYNAQAEASPESGFLFGRLRGSYEVLLGNDFYMRPTVDLDVIAVHQQGYTESGAGALNLNVRSNSQSFYAITPSVEFGQRLNLPGGAGRLYLSLGATFMSGDDWQTSATFAGVSDMDAFSSSVPIAGDLARIGLGLDLPQSAGFQVKVQYDGAIGTDFQAHGGSVFLNFRF